MSSIPSLTELLERAVFLRLLEKIGDCGLSHLFGQEIERGGGLFAGASHGSILARQRAEASLALRPFPNSWNCAGIARGLGKAEVAERVRR